MVPPRVPLTSSSGQPCPDQSQMGPDGSQWAAGVGGKPQGPMRLLECTAPIGAPGSSFLDFGLSFGDSQIRQLPSGSHRRQSVCRQGTPAQGPQSLRSRGEGQIQGTRAALCGEGLKSHCGA